MVLLRASADHLPSIDPAEALDMLQTVFIDAAALHRGRSCLSGWGQIRLSRKQTLVSVLEEQPDIRADGSSGPRRPLRRGPQPLGRSAASVRSQRNQVIVRARAPDWIGAAAIPKDSRRARRGPPGSMRFIVARGSPRRPSSPACMMPIACIDSYHRQ